MKRLVFVAIVVLLLMTVLTISCTPKPTQAPAPKVPAQNVTGILKEVTPSPAGGGTVTIQTPQGESTVRFGTNTTFSLEGKACTLDQLDALELAKVSYNCTTIYNEWGELLALNITKTFP